MKIELDLEKLEIVILALNRSWSYATTELEVYRNSPIGIDIAAERDCFARVREQVMEQVYPDKPGTPSTKHQSHPEPKQTIRRPNPPVPPDRFHVTARNVRLLYPLPRSASK